MSSNWRRTLTILTGAVLWFGGLTFGDKSPYEWAQIKLDFARDEKYEQLDRLCQALQAKAAGIRTDNMMLDFFEISLTVTDSDREQVTDPEALRLHRTLKDQYEKFRRLVHRHYLKEYISFRDILFVGTSGEVIYSLRKSSDYQTNVLTGPAQDSPLARGLRRAGEDEVFVDFFEYPAADEPVALFIEPAGRNDQRLGWFVLEVTLNKFNSLFTGHEQLASTSETFLVNRSGYLLTESSFVGNATVLRMKLDDRNIEPKFAAERGNRCVVDYRGFQVLTSFAVYRMMDTQWLIVAKVDEAEVLTHYFLDHFSYFYGRIAKQLSFGKPWKGQIRPADTDRHGIMVDMDEFVKADPEDWLETVGVSTCTALVAAIPGKFGYLAHISPFDQMYGQQGTNILGNLFKKIMHYDIYPFQRRQIKIAVIATHLKSLEAILRKLTAEGLLLSQIAVFYNPDAASANAVYDPQRDWLGVEWLPTEDGKSPSCCIFGEENNLENVFKTILEPADIP